MKKQETVQVKKKKKNGGRRIIVSRDDGICKKAGEYDSHGTEIRNSDDNDDA